MSRIALILAGVLALPATASAQVGAGTFDSTFKKVVDNCEGRGLTLSEAPIKVSTTGGAVLVDIPKLPQLRGRAGRGGKLRASGKGQSGQLSASYHLNGRANGKDFQAVFVAEFSKGETPVCTQSFRVSGTKQ